MRSDLHDIRVIYQTETAAAVCIRETEDGADVWIPWSQCEVGSPRYRGQVVTLTAPEAVLTEKGLL